ncbi:MAG TPA: riboflavin synthase [Xanthomonadales bacterium]|nr:riboflavin synthase [Xanthomonadales bacterium]
MFTGIVMSRGTVLEALPLGGDLRLRIHSGSISLDDCMEGDSIAVAGVCLTMLQPRGLEFFADVSAETLALTTLGTLQVNSTVNLELALTLQDRLGGHLVSGHVDGMGKLLGRHEEGRAERFEFELPHTLARYVASKGSITIDGVSLTVNEVRDNEFSVCLIPHTLQVTTLGKLQRGHQVNIEVDLVARYLERLLSISADFKDKSRSES